MEASVQLDLKTLESVQPGAVFASGTISNSPMGIFMTRQGGFLKWVAVRGLNSDPDWAVYVGWPSQTIEEIARFGDKLYNAENVKRCISVTNEVLSRYRF